jgi:hypothetical protein
MRLCVVFGCVLALAGVLPAANILPNPSFEYWLGNTPVGWLTSEPLFPGTALQDSNSHTGVYCVKLVGGDTSAFMSSATIVRAGYNYEFSGFVRVPGVLGGSFVLQFTTLLGGAVGTPELLPVYYSGSSYREYTRWVAAPDSATFLTVSIATLPNVTVYVDDVTVEDTTVAGMSEGREKGNERVRERGAGVRKVVGLWADAERAGRTLGTVPMRGQSLFDPLGRRVAGRPARGGVYFVMPER